MIGTLIEGLDETIYDDVGIRYYHSKKLKDVGMFIEVQNHLTEGTNGEPVSETWIAVNRLKLNDAVTYVLYWQDSLSDIQIYRIIKDVWELFNELELSFFEKVMQDMSSQFMSASMQSRKQNKEEMLTDMQKQFTIVYEGEEVL